MIYDCVSFFNELELLEIRLNELDPLVDFFLISEATATHRGNPKPLYFRENEHLFKPWIHKIRYIIVDFPADLEAQCKAGLYKEDIHVHRAPPEGLSLDRARERYQRNAIIKGLINCKDSDIIILCDLDEIPCAKSLQGYHPSQGIRHLQMGSFYYYLNTKVGEWNRPAKILPYSLLKQSTPSIVRESSTPPLENSTGWHYSYMGGAERVTYKIQSFAHPEYDTPATTIEAIEHMIKTRPTTDYTYCNDFPEYVVKNQEQFKKLGFLKKPEIELKETFLPVVLEPPRFPAIPKIISGPYRPACG